MAAGFRPGLSRLAGCFIGVVYSEIAKLGQHGPERKMTGHSRQHREAQELDMVIMRCCGRGEICPYVRCLSS